MALLHLVVAVAMIPVLQGPSPLNPPNPLDPPSRLPLAGRQRRSARGSLERVSGWHSERVLKAFRRVQGNGGTVS